MLVYTGGSQKISISNHMRPIYACKANGIVIHSFLSNAVKGFPRKRYMQVLHDRVLKLHHCHNELAKLCFKLIFSIISIPKMSSFCVIDSRAAKKVRLPLLHTIRAACSVGKELAQDQPCLRQTRIIERLPPCHACAVCLRL